MIVYIHGYGSKADPKNEKVKGLKSIYDVKFVEYDSNDTFENIKTSLIEQFEKIGKDNFDLIVGSSLGGYWARVMGYEFSKPHVLINPCINPKETLVKHGIDVGLTYEPITLSEDVHCLILLDLGDDVIDPFKTIELFRYKVKIHAFENGSHRFVHIQESLPIIKSFYNNSLII